MSKDKESICVTVRVRPLSTKYPAPITIDNCNKIPVSVCAWTRPSIWSPWVAPPIPKKRLRISILIRFVILLGRIRCSRGWANVALSTVWRGIIVPFLPMGRLAQGKLLPWWVSTLRAETISNNGASFLELLNTCSNVFRKRSRSLGSTTLSNVLSSRFIMSRLLICWALRTVRSISARISRKESTLKELLKKLSAKARKPWIS